MGPLYCHIGVLLLGGHAAPSCTSPAPADASTRRCPSLCTTTTHAWIAWCPLVRSELLFMSKSFGHGWEFLPFRLLKLGTKSLTVKPTCHGAAAPLFMTYTHTLAARSELSCQQHVSWLQEGVSSWCKVRNILVRCVLSFSAVSLVMGR